jgi:hypothetical protein
MDKSQDFQFSVPVWPSGTLSWGLCYYEQRPSRVTDHLEVTSETPEGGPLVDLVLLIPLWGV